MSPVIIALILRKKLSFPVDFGKTWNKKRIAGDHKTWRGIIAAMLGGYLIFLLQKHAYTTSDFWFSISLIDYTQMTPWFGAMLGLGAILGDLIKSIAKRQMGIPSGKNWFPFDQIDYIVGGVIALFFFYIPSMEIILLILLLSFVLHFIIGHISMPLKNFGNT